MRAACLWASVGSLFLSRCGCWTRIRGLGRASPGAGSRQCIVLAAISGCHSFDGLTPGPRLSDLRHSAADCRRMMFARHAFDIAACPAELPANVRRSTMARTSLMSHHAAPGPRILTLDCLFFRAWVAYPESTRDPSPETACFFSRSKPDAADSCPSAPDPPRAGRWPEALSKSGRKPGPPPCPEADRQSTQISLAQTPVRATHGNLHRARLGPGHNT